MAGYCAMPAPRLASDCPAHVLYPCRHEAISEHSPDAPCRGIPGYRDDSLRPYNGSMGTPRNHGAVGVGPRSAVAGSFVDGLVAQDFAELGGALAADACLRALLPSGLREWAGAEAIARVFARWFGDTEDFELIDASVGEVGGRLHLQWRLRLRAQRLGTGWFTVEQQAYADTDDGGRIAQLDLLCTGFRPGDGHD
jgi:hypothetical protein